MMRTVVHILTAVAVALFLFRPPEIIAAPIVDQSQLAPFQGDASVSAIQDVAQTFTVGIAGKLTRIDVEMKRQSSATLGLLFDVRPTVAGIPDINNASALASLSIPASSVPAATLSMISFDISAQNLFVSVGDVLAFVLRSAAPFPSYNESFNFGNPYLSGTAFLRSPGPNSWSLAASGIADARFQTFVDPTAPVPEPATILLLGGGLPGLAGFGRRRKGHFERV